MLDYRLYRHQNFLKKVQKKVRFSTEKRQILRKKITFSRKIFKIFFFLSSKFPACFFPAFFTIIDENVKMRSAFAERTRNYLLFFVSEVINMRPQVLAFLCFGRQNSLNNDSILQTFLLQTTTILIRLGNIAVN